MRFSSTLLSLASLGLVSAYPTIDGREVVSHAMNMPRDRSQNPSPCGVDASPEFVAVMQDMAAAEANGTLPSTLDAGFTASAVAATVTVPVYFHVVAINTTPAGGYLTAAQLSAQITYMNNAFSATDYTVNTAWANDRSELTMKRALRKGGYNAVNIYFQYFLADNNLGVSIYKPFFVKFTDMCHSTATTQVPPAKSVARQHSTQMAAPFLLPPSQAEP
jgi:hypothetical protein